MRPQAAAFLSKIVLDGKRSICSAHFKMDFMWSEYISLVLDLWPYGNYFSFALTVNMKLNEQFAKLIFLSNWFPSSSALFVQKKVDF